MTSMFKKFALGLGLATAALVATAPAQAQDTNYRDHGNGYSQVRHNDEGGRHFDRRDHRGYRAERYVHQTRHDSYRTRDHRSHSWSNRDRNDHRGY